jgi:hypothetical protein
MYGSNSEAAVHVQLYASGPVCVWAPLLLLLWICLIKIMLLY